MSFFNKRYEKYLSISLILILVLAVLLGVYLYVNIFSKSVVVDKNNYIDIMPKIGDKVIVDYELKVGDFLVESTFETDSNLDFVLGNRDVIVGFENAVLSMVVGETKTVLIPAKEAYGELIDVNYPLELVLEFINSYGEEYEDLDSLIGAELFTQSGGICAFAGYDDFNAYMLCGNHRFSGKDLLFKIKLLEIVK